jgi:hypothetical protein
MWLDIAAIVDLRLRYRGFITPTTSAISKRSDPSARPQGFVRFRKAAQEIYLPAVNDKKSILHRHVWKWGFQEHPELPVWEQMLDFSPSGPK